jgi:hypothetical protein
LDEEYIWGDAEVTYPDWTGTAQLDRRMTAPSLGEVVGLDREEWLLVGFDIGGGEHLHHLRVVAVRRNGIPAGSDVLPRIAAANDGEIPATEFWVHNVDPYEVLRAITHQFELRMRISTAREFPIRIVAQRDLPDQG